MSRVPPPATAPPRPMGEAARRRLPGVLGAGPLLALLGLATATLAVSDPASHFPVAILGTLGLLVTLGLGKLQPEREIAQFLLSVMLLAAGVRFFLFALVHQTVGPYVFAPDQLSFELLGQGLVNTWQGIRPLPSQLEGSLQVGYPIINALSILTFGPARAAVPILNIFLASWCAIPVYHTLRHILPGNPGVARTAVWLTLFFPSMLLWSILNIREAPSIFLIMLTVFLVVRFQNRGKFFDLLWALAPLALLTLFREYLTVLVGVSVAAGIFMGRSRRPLRSLLFGVAFMGVVTIGLQSLGVGGSLVQEPTLERVEYLRQDLAFGAGSAYGQNFDVSSPAGALAFLPVGVVYFMLAPFPWAISSSLQSFTLPETLLWYTLLPFGLWGFFLALRHDARGYTVPAAVLLVMTVAYSLVEGNVGTAYRHRAQILPLVFIFCAVGVRDAWGAWKMRREARLARRRRVAEAVGRGGPGDGRYVGDRQG